MRQARIQNQLQNIRQLPFLEVVQCMPKGIERNDVWMLWIPGKADTLWSGGVFPVEITFPKDYPKCAPHIQFQPQFQHVHVYQGGAICMPLLQSEYWKSKTTMTDILQRIIAILHQDVNPYSPANGQLFRIYRQQPARYQQIIKQQTAKYSKQSPKYFEQACIHINIINN